MSILTSADYPEIRSAIDATLDATMLPDAQIAFDSNVGEAEREVLTRDPLALTRIGNDGARVRLAAIYLTAARLVVTLPVVTAEQLADERVTRQAWDPVARAAALRGMASDLFGAYLEPSSPAALVPFAFATMCGRRGR